MAGAAAAQRKRDEAARRSKRLARLFRLLLRSAMDSQLVGGGHGGGTPCQVAWLTLLLHTRILHTLILLTLILHTLIGTPC